jgi:tRNA(Phe) wybutosine-synthesizing methylase Tyw3
MLIVEFDIYRGYIAPSEIPMRTNKRKLFWSNSSCSGRIGVVARVGEFQRIFDDLVVPNEAPAKDPISSMETCNM